MLIQQSTTSTVRYEFIEANQGYRIGDDGSAWSRVKSARGGKVVYGEWRRLKPSPQKSGHMRIYLGRENMRFVHRLVLEHFVGPCPDGMECCHWDGNPANNRLSNLRWDTPKGNGEDRVRLGESPRGEDAAMAVLTEDAVRAIVAECAAGEIQSVVAARHGVHETNINAIVTGRSWSHLTGIKYEPKRPGRKGEKRQKLSDDDVRDIREWGAAGIKSAEIGRRKGISDAMVRLILSGRRRADVQPRQPSLQSRPAQNKGRGVAAIQSLLPF